MFQEETESGQALVEYGLILLLVAMALIITLGLFGSNTILPMFEKVRDLIPKLG